MKNKLNENSTLSLMADHFSFSKMIKKTIYNIKITITLFIVCILLCLQSCSPKVSINRKSGILQKDNTVELRAKTKRFKSKNGPVNINWFVNGVPSANGNSFLFSIPDLKEYSVRAEATQGSKTVEKEIKLVGSAFDPKVVDLVNGVELFKEKPATPLKTIGTTPPVEKQEEVQKGDSKVTTVWTEHQETYSASKNPDEFVMYDPNANVLWPGALVQAKSLASGVPDIIPIGSTYRLPARVTLSILSGDDSGVENKFYRDTEMNKSSVTQAMNDILSKYKGATPAQYSYTKELAHSSSQVQFDLSMGYAGPTNKVDGKLGINWSENKSRMVVKLYQKFFTMTYDDPQGLEGIFRPAIKYNDLKPYVGAGNPACYISSVTYGRTFVLIYESDASQLDLNAAVNYAYDGVVAEGYVEADLKTAFKTMGVTVKAVQIGGDAKEGLLAVTDPLNPEKIRNFITNGANFSSTNPGEIISYTVNYLKDASLVRMNSAMEYTVTQKTPIRSDEWIIVPAITDKSQLEAEASLKSKGFQMKILHTTPDCSRAPGTVIHQDQKPGDLILAGSTVGVILVKDRPIVKAPSIPGKGKLHKLNPEGEDGDGAWAWPSKTDVAFALEGDECTTGTVILKHPLIAQRTYNLEAGEQVTLKEVFGVGKISLKFVSSDSKAKLYYRIW